MLNKKLCGNKKPDEFVASSNSLVIILYVGNVATHDRVPEFSATWSAKGLCEAFFLPENCYFWL